MKSGPQMELEAAAKVNRQAIQEFVNELYGLSDKQFEMGILFTGDAPDIVPPHTCGSVGCIAGWYWAFYTHKEFPSLAMIVQIMATTFRVSGREMLNLCSFRDDHYVFGMDTFDETVPAHLRKQSMIRVLEMLMDTGKCMWTSALVEVLGAEDAKRLTTWTIKGNGQEARPSGS